jgi:serine/threonine-protein kinase ULK/ATG1
MTTRVLGSGAFGTVFYGFKKDDENQPYAVKFIKINEKKMIGITTNEIKIMKSIKSKFVVELNASTATRSNNFYIVMEYCNGGDLDKFRNLRGGGFLVEKDARILIK